MEPRLDVLTLGVRDLAVARRFYVDGLGWSPRLEVAQEVVFVQVGHGLLLALYGADDLARDTGDDGAAGRSTAPVTVTLGHIVHSEPEVDAVLETAERAGGQVVRAGRRMDWGGYSGFFADPDGYRWEVAHNPGFRVEDDGTVVIGPVEG